MYVCMLCMYACMYACMYVYMCVCMYLECVYICLYVYECLYVRRYVLVWDSSEGTKKTTRNLTQESRSPDQDFNPGYPEYKAGVVDVPFCGNITTNTLILYIDSKGF
jgi:hypothetical protein